MGSVRNRHASPTTPDRKMKTRVESGAASFDYGWRYVEKRRANGRVERVAPHGHEAEVVIRTGSLAWIVSLVEPAVEQLELKPGASVHLIIKARSCHVLGEGATGS